MSLGNYVKWGNEKCFKCQCQFLCFKSHSLDHVHDLLAVVEPDVMVGNCHPLECDLENITWKNYFGKYNLEDM